MFDTFDHPDMNVTAGARNVSTVPTQALTLMNNPFVLSEAALFAARIASRPPIRPSQVDAGLSHRARAAGDGAEIGDRHRPDQPASRSKRSRTSS